MLLIGIMLFALVNRVAVLGTSLNDWLNNLEQGLSVADPPSSGQSKVSQPLKLDDHAVENDVPVAGADVSDSEYMYQVYAGIYSNRWEAENARSVLRQRGGSPIVIDAGTGSYLLLVETFGDIAAANSRKAELVGRGFPSALVTRQSRSQASR